MQLPSHAINCPGQMQLAPSQVASGGHLEQLPAVVPEEPEEPATLPVLATGVVPVTPAVPELPPFSETALLAAPVRPPAVLSSAPFPPLPAPLPLLPAILVVASGLGPVAEEPPMMAAAPENSAPFIPSVVVSPPQSTDKSNRPRDTAPPRFRRYMEAAPQEVSPTVLVTIVRQSIPSNSNRTEAQKLLSAPRRWGSGDQQRQENRSEVPSALFHGPVPALAPNRGADGRQPSQASFACPVCRSNGSRYCYPTDLLRVSTQHRTRWHGRVENLPFQTMCRILSAILANCLLAVPVAVLSLGCSGTNSIPKSQTAIATYRYRHVETTGITDELFLRGGERQPIKFASESAPAEIATLGEILKCGIFGTSPSASTTSDDAFEQRLHVVGELRDRKLKTPDGPGRAMPEVYKEFVVQTWYLEAPFSVVSGFGTGEQGTSAPTHYTSIMRACPHTVSRDNIDRFVRTGRN